MTQSMKKPLKKSVSSNMDNMMIQDCKTCQYHQPRSQSIDDVLPICWDCLGTQNATGFPLPFWKPNENL